MSVPASLAPTAHGLPQTGFLRISQIVPAIIPVSRATFLRRVKDGAADGFPQPVRIGAGRAVFFRAEEIRAFVASSGAVHA